MHIAHSGFFSASPKKLKEISLTVVRLGVRHLDSCIKQAFLLGLSTQLDVRSPSYDNPFNNLNLSKH